jgi:hypothetical protein
MTVTDPEEIANTGAKQCSTREKEKEKKKKKDITQLGYGR